MLTTYSTVPTLLLINQVIHNSSLDLIHLKHEITEMALVDVPDEIKHLGITDI